MSFPVAEAAKFWHDAQKIRKSLEKDIARLLSTRANIEDEKWDLLEGLLARLRLTCVSILFIDFDSAATNGVEESLWKMHVDLKNLFKARIGTAPSNSAQDRRLKRRYGAFLKTSRYFYCGYIQRLSQRYDIAEIHQIAAGIGVESGPGADAIASLSDELKRKILSSCHSTLVRLGDIGRYRYDAKPAVPRLHDAVAFYRLAKDLRPNSGFGQHQIGVAYLDTRNLLDIVYNFCGSLSRERPHPKALDNLDQALKRRRNAGSAMHAETAREILESWFTLLHAQFFHGKPFPQHEELEQTVLRRTEAAARDPSNAFGLVKMALVNMSAFYIAGRYFESEPDRQIMFGHFTLRANVRFIAIVSGLIAKGLDGSSRPMPGDETQGSGSASSAWEKDITASVEVAIRILRLYCAWITANRQYIDSAPESIQPWVTQMWASLYKALECLYEYFKDLVGTLDGSSDGLPSTCPYLLEEDQETLGMLSVSNRFTDEHTRMYHFSGAIKPLAAHFAGGRYLSAKETLYRVSDILVSAAKRIADGSLPFQLPVPTHDISTRVDNLAETQPTEPEVVIQTGLPDPTQVSQDQEQAQSMSPLAEAGSRSSHLPPVFAGNSIVLPVVESVLDATAKPAGTSPRWIEPTPTTNLESVALPWSYFHVPTPTGEWKNLDANTYYNPPNRHSNQGAADQLHLRSPLAARSTLKPMSQPFVPQQINSNTWYQPMNQAPPSTFSPPSIPASHYTSTTIPAGQAQTEQVSPSTLPQNSLRSPGVSSAVRDSMFRTLLDLSNDHQQQQYQQGGSSWQNGHYSPYSATNLDSNIPDNLTKRARL